MAQSSIGPPSGLRTFYPYINDSYDDQTSSDITLCFGENEKVYAHKIILKAASGVWKQAFNSKLPISTQDTYNIQGHSNLVTYTMIRYIYGIPLDPEPSSMSEAAQLDYLLEVFAIANEYHIPSLGQAITERAIQLMKSCVLDPETIRTSCYYPDLRAEADRKTFGAILSRTADLYINNNVADKSLLNGVLDTCFARCTDLKWMEEHLQISALIGKYDPFAGRLLQLYLPGLRFSR
jgi:hypothetical protein